MKEPVAFIGTGIMGAPMALNLLRAGYPVTVHNRTRQRAEPLLSAGATWADSPAQAALGNRFVFICLPDSPDVETALVGSGGVLSTAAAGTICIDHSTISPQATERLARTLQAKGITLLDAPVSGGQIGAIEARLSIMVGGPSEALEAVRPMLECMGKTIIHCGASGCGQKTKLVNQIMVVSTLLSAAEGLAFAKRAGLNLDTTLAVTAAGAAKSASLANLGPKMIAGDWKPAFKVDLQLKDLRLVMELAKSIGQPLPGTALVQELLSKLAAQGRGQDGTQALFEVIESLASK